MSTSSGFGNIKQYYCYQCDAQVNIIPPSSPTSEIVCPNCSGTFVEESETAPVQSIPPENPFPFPDHNIFGPQTEFNPFAFLNDYIQSRGNVQLVFESNRGIGIGTSFGTGGTGTDAAANFGDYFMGPGLEQLIQQLAENDPNRYGTPPAAKNVVETLPDVCISEEMLVADDSEQEQCAVCKDSFVLGEVAKQMPCKHIYHKDCIVPWLEMHNSCPVCRYELPTDDQEYENRRRNGEVEGGRGSGLRGIVGGTEGTPRAALERRFRISLPGLFRTRGETSASGSGSGGNNEANNQGGSGSGGQARQEDLD